MEGIIQILAKVPLLAKLSSTDLELLEKKCQIKNARRGQFILKSGDSPNTIGIIIEGAAKVCRANTDGKELTIALLGPNGYFGSVAALINRKRNTDVIATCRCTYLDFEAQGFLLAINRIPELSYRLLCSVANRLDQTSRHLFENSIYDLDQRLVLRLLEMSVVVEINEQEKLLVRQRPAHQELANMLGASREAITRSLRQLEEDGHIVVNDDQVFVISTPVV